MPVLAIHSLERYVANAQVTGEASGVLEIDFVVSMSHTRIAGMESGPEISNIAERNFGPFRSLCQGY